MGVYPPSVERLIQQFARFPGIGQKSASRMALHVLRSEQELAESLARALLEVKERIRLCSCCFNLTDQDPCPICDDPARAQGTLCVVESPADQLALEESGAFKGRYHVLHGVLSPLEGVGPEDLKIRQLLLRLPREDIREVILATNPTTEGEATASYLAHLLTDQAPAVRVTRIALGIPMGGDLKYTDRMTLTHALRFRMPLPP